MGLCTILAILIGMSRIALGLHSWNQVLVGFLVSLVFISFITKKRFMNFVSKIDPKKLLKFSLIFFGVSLIIQIVMFIINREDNRFDKDYWKP
jgi:membrane-associated phospholipid phosphatase